MMINDKEKEDLKSRFGSLMVRRVICVSLLKDYDKELKSIDAEINELVKQYVGDEDNGTISEEK